MQLGKFEILEELGRGGFGVVYKTRDKALNRLVAIKILHPNLVNDLSFLGRFRQEAQIAGNLDHPNLVPVHDFGEAEGHYYIVMGYMPGGSLKDLIKQEGPLSQERALEVLTQIGEGLSYAHSRNVIHRDLKPGNILFDERGIARVSDMGFAKLLHSENNASMSTTGGLLGTPAYIAPEMWNGQPATTATDVYALACILLEMLTGKAFFGGDTTPLMMKKHFERLNLPADLPQEWKPVVARALEKDPSRRIQSINELITKLIKSNTPVSGLINSNELTKTENSSSRNSSETNIGNRPSAVSGFHSMPLSQQTSSPMHTSYLQEYDQKKTYPPLAPETQTVQTGSGDASSTPKQQKISIVLIVVLILLLILGFLIFCSIISMFQSISVTI